MSQKKLKGRPRTMGYTRSQSETEKQTARKGMHPRKIDASDGGLKGVSLSDDRRNSNRSSQKREFPWRSGGPDTGASLLNSLRA